MKTLIAIIMTIFMATTSTANTAATPKYHLILNEPEVVAECTNKDVVIGATVGAAIGAFAGISSVVGAPVVGAAAGTTFTWGMAFSSGWLINLTAPTMAVGSVIGAGLFGVPAYYISCVINNIR